MLEYTEEEDNSNDEAGCGSRKCNALTCTMDVLSIIKHSILTDTTNPITKYFELGRQVGSAGPEMTWKIYEAVRIEDKREASVFVFDKKIADKLHKPRRRETVSEILRREVYQLERIKHPNILSVVHGLEECHDNLAFATEPVVGSLANILGNFDRIQQPIPNDLKDHDFIDAEIKYGLLQITEAVSFLHFSEQKLHRNICPQSILITKRGGWKLAGMGFAEESKDGKGCFPCRQWTQKIPKMAQPDLNYVAPEIQMEKTCNYLSDMFSLGILICSVFNEGKSLIAAEHMPGQYVRELDQMHDQFGVIAHKMPLKLVDPVEKMINKNVRYRPTSQVFSTHRYFQDPVVTSLQHLDTHDRNDEAERAEVYANLSQIIPSIPRKMLYKNVFPVLIADCKSNDILYALPSLLTMIDYATRDDYVDNILPEFRSIMQANKPVTATVYILNKLDIILAKTPLEEIKGQVLPMVFNTLESTSLQAQEAAVGAINGIKEYLDNSIIRKMVLPKAKSLFYRSSNVKLKTNALTCIDHMLDSLDKMLILDEILPFLADVTCQDAEVVMTLVGIYRHLLSDKKYGLTHNLIATRVMPSLIPQTVNPGLNMEQEIYSERVMCKKLSHINTAVHNVSEKFEKSTSISFRIVVHNVSEKFEKSTSISFRIGVVDSGDRLDLTFSALMEVLREMLEQIDRQRRDKMKMETVSITVPPRLNIEGPDSGGDHDITGKESSSKLENGTASSFEMISSLHSSKEVLVSNKRNHSLHSFGMSLDEKSTCTLDKPQDIQRRHSLVPPPSSGPTISITSDDNSPDRPRRPSTHSLGPFSVSGFGEYHYRGGDKPRRPSTHSVGILPISMFGEGGERPRRPSTHSLGVFCFGEDREKYDKHRRPSTHSLGPYVVPDFERRGSRGSIFGNLGLGTDANPFAMQRDRRASFQSFGESVMQLFK